VLSTELGVALFFSGRPSAALAPLERGLVLAERLELGDRIPHAMHRYALALTLTGRLAEARALFEEAIAMAERLGRSDDMIAAQTNSSDLMLRYDQPGGLERSLEALATARRVGNRGFESVSAANALSFLTLLGRWEEVDRLDAELTPDDGTERPDAEFVHTVQVEVAVHRGDVAAGEERLARCQAFAESGNSESRLMYVAARGLVLAAAGDVEAALPVLMDALRASDATLGHAGEATRIGYGPAIDLALDAGRTEDAATLLAALDGVQPGMVSRLRRTHHRRGVAKLAAARGEHDDVEAGLRAALASYEDMGYVYWAAYTRADLAAWLIDRDRSGEAWPLLDEAELTFTSLGARPALERVQELRAGAPVRA
jgi:tetratricopeptide (TPR) repeat protein